MITNQPPGIFTMVELSRKEVPKLLLQLQKACHRPLYVNVELNQSRWNPKPSDNTHRQNSSDLGCDAETNSQESLRPAAGKRQRAEEKVPEKTWEEVREQDRGFRKV
jgi:hypothetical protein